MNFFKSLKNGMEAANQKVNSVEIKTEKINFETINKQISDPLIDNVTIAINVKKFMQESLNPTEIDQVINSFITKRPDARDILLKK